MKTIALAAGLASSVLMLLASPEISQARTRHVYHRQVHRQYSGCQARRHEMARNGTIIGAVGGGLIGNQLAGGGSRTLGTVLGAGGGAVLGHKVGADSHRC